MTDKSQTMSSQIQSQTNAIHALVELVKQSREYSETLEAKVEELQAQVANSGIETKTIQVTPNINITIEFIDGNPVIPLDEVYLINLGLIKLIGPLLSKSPELNTLNPQSMLPSELKLSTLQQLVEDENELVYRD